MLGGRSRFSILELFSRSRPTHLYTKSLSARAHDNFLFSSESRFPWICVHCVGLLFFGKPISNRLLSLSYRIEAQSNQLKIQLNRKSRRTFTLSMFNDSMFYFNLLFLVWNAHLLMALHVFFRFVIILLSFVCCHIFTHTHKTTYRW